MRLFLTRRLPLDPAEVVGPGIEVDVFEHDRPPTRAEMAGRGGSAAGLVTLLTDPIDAPLLDALPGVRVIANMAVGRREKRGQAVIALTLDDAVSQDVLNKISAAITVDELCAIDLNG